MNRVENERGLLFPTEQIPKLMEPVRKDVQLYVQIYDVLYELIRSGKAQPGCVIPGENVLAAHFGVSRGTIRQALRYLEEDGLVVKRQGRGSEITDIIGHQQGGLQIYSDVCREFCTVPISRVNVKWKYTGAGQWLSEQLELPKGALVVSSDILFYKGRDAIALSQRLVPAAFLEQFSVDPNSNEEMRAFLLDTLPQSISRTRTEIIIKTDGLAESISSTLPFFSVSEITYDPQDKPVAHFKNYLRSDCYRLYVSRRCHVRGN